MGRLGRDDPDGSTVSPGVLITGSGIPSTDVSNGSGFLSTGDGNDELGVVDEGGNIYTGSGGNQTQHKGRDVRWVSAPDHVHAHQAKDSGHADRALGPALLLVNHEDGSSNHFDDSA
jgi:hypothetical protein